MLKNWKYSQPEALNRMLLGKKVVHKSYTQTDTVASGSTEQVTLTCPEGKIWFLKTLFLRVNADADATSGTHQLRLKVNPNGVWVIRGKSNYDSHIIFGHGHWWIADVSADPPDSATPQAVVSSTLIDDDDGITFEYVNNTDAAQENKRTIVFDALELLVS